VAWSPWQPRPGGDALFDIVDHVAKEYRLPGHGNDQLVLVQPQPLELKNGELAQLAVEQPGAAGVDKVLLPGTPIAYRFCGLGKTCALPGKPSAGRLTLLRREALELALYTFNYVADIDGAVVLMPPVPGAKPSHALFFRPQDVQPSLQNPLVDTLPGPTPTVNALMRSRNLPIVNSITAPLQFDFSVTQDNTNNRGYLVLDTPK